MHTRLLMLTIIFIIVFVITSNLDLNICVKVSFNNIWPFWNDKFSEILAQTLKCTKQEQNQVNTCDDTIVYKVNNKSGRKYC